MSSSGTSAMIHYLALLPTSCYIVNAGDQRIFDLVGEEAQKDVYWDIQLDPDLLQTLVAIYPEWFQDYNLDLMGEEGISFPLLNQDKPLNSPPKAEVDHASIRMSMDKNKESLKLKLMLRRPIHQLVEQGIIPPPKHSPNFYEQSKKLERARMEDFLKHKIQRRPDRQALIQKHILEDTSVSPSIHSKQRQLKRARLADDLNDRLSHRPGPLELIKGNILLTDEKFAQAVKQGQIQFKATCEGEPVKYPPPRFVIEEETSSDDSGSPSQSQLSEKFVANEKDNLSSVEPIPSSSVSSNNGVEVTACSTMTLNQIASNIMAPNMQNQTVSIRTINPFTQTTTAVPVTTVSQVLRNFNVVSPSNFTANTAVVGSVSSPPSTPVSSTSNPSPPQTTFVASTAVKESSQSLPKNRKKSKSKSQPKTKTIKFHEYKGPPSAQKNQSLANCASESSYELLLKQQQLFLQWQLEWQQKYPQIILPSAQKNNLDQGSRANAQTSTSSTLTPLILNTSRSQANIETNSTNIPNSVGSNDNQAQNGSSKMILKLEDMKVSDLKSELKKRNLPVSGSKPQLIERLKPFVDSLLHSMGIPQAHQNIEQSYTSNIKANLIGKGDAGNTNVSRADETVPMSPSTGKGETEKEKSLISDKSSLSDSPMELDSGSLNGSLTIQSYSESAGKIQQRRLEDIQRELQQGHFQLQFQDQPVFTSAIPLSALTSSQIQIVATSSANDTVNLEPKGCSKQIFQTNNTSQSQSIVQPSSNIAIISPANGPTLLLNAENRPKTGIASGSTAKANLALFLNRHQNQNHQQQIPPRTILTQPNTTQQIHIQQFVPPLTVNSDRTQTLGIVNSSQNSNIDGSLGQKSMVIGKGCNAQYSSNGYKVEDNRANVAQQADLGSKYLTIKQSTFSLPLLTTQVLDPKIFPTFQILYPTVDQNQQTAARPQVQQQSSPHPQSSPSQQKAQISSPPPQSSEISRCKQSRTNSLPNELLPQMSVSQRTSSLPNFSTFVSTNPGSFTANTTNIVSQVKPPPAYEEATKDLAKSNSKKFDNNQAFDDVIEILMRNGEFPVPMETSECNSNRRKENPGYNVANLGDSNLYPPATNSSNHNQAPKEDNLANFFNANFDDVNTSQAIPLVATDECQKSPESNMSQNNVKKSQASHSEIYTVEKDGESKPVPNYEVTGSDLLLNEFMDLQESSMNVDYSNWLSELIPDSNQMHQKNNSVVTESKNIESNSHFVKTHVPFFGPLDCESSKEPFSSNSFSSSTSSSRTSSDHDPVLANHMFENNINDPLMDFHFDMESDSKEASDLINLVWDRIDFAT